MNKAIANVLVFAVGAAIGSAATWYYAKKKYEKIAQEEIDSVKQVFSEKHGSPEPTENSTDESLEPPTIEETREYADIIKSMSYTVEEPNVYKEPYTISPNEMGEVEEYDTMSLLYFADKVLTYDNYKLVEDIPALIGSRDVLETFGEYEEDSVFVRNERLKTDVEILMDIRTYSDVLEERPYLMEV